MDRRQFFAGFIVVSVRELRGMDEWFAACRDRTTGLTVATARTERITQSVLGKAFSGELVETEADLARREGRDYEPASVLLERITAERETASKKPT